MMKIVLYALLFTASYCSAANTQVKPKLTHPITVANLEKCINLEGNLNVTEQRLCFRTCCRKELKAFLKQHPNMERIYADNNDGWQLHDLEREIIQEEKRAQRKGLSAPSS